MKVTNILAILILACLSFTSCQKDAALLSNQQQTGDNAAVETPQDDLALRQCRQKFPMRLP